MNMRVMVAALSLSALIAGAALAHHNAANTYMQGEPVVWNGKVTFVSWDGAHVMYQVDFQKPDGTLASHQVLGGSPQRLAKRGILKTTVHTGDSVTVAGYLQPGGIVTPIYLRPMGGAKLYVGYVTSDASFPQR